MMPGMSMHSDVQALAELLDFHIDQKCPSIGHPEKRLVPDNNPMPIMVSTESRLSNNSSI